MTALRTSWNNLTELPIFEILLMVLSCVTLVKFIQYNWKIRHLYKATFEIPGPFYLLPIFNTWMLFLPASYVYRIFMSLFEKYPDKFRVWSGKELLIVISNAEDLEIILNSPKCLSKNFLYEFTRPFGGNGIFAAEPSVWKVHRRSITPAFNQKSLNGFVNIFAKHANALNKKYKKVAGKGDFNISSYLSVCIVDILYETIMGTENTAEGSQLAECTERVFEVIFQRLFYVPFYSDRIYKLSKLYRDEQRNAKFIHNLTKQLVHEKKLAYESRMKEMKDILIAPIEEGKEHKSLLDMLIEISYEEGKFTEKEVQEEIDTALIAGTDTSTSANSFLYMILGMYQDIQQKVYEEIMDVLGPERDIEFTDLSKLKYTERVIKESQRLFPVASLLARLVAEDTDLGSCVLPAGSSVIIGLMHVQRNPKYWPDPLRVDPDRFLPEEVAKRHPFSYVPFSAGPRNCIGMRYALMAMKSLTAMVVRRYRIHSSYKSIEEVKLSSDNIVLRPEHGYKVSLELRS